MTNKALNINTSAFSVTSFTEADRRDKDYWLSKSPQERLHALEVMRQINYAYDPATDSIQRTIEVVKRA